MTRLSRLSMALGTGAIALGAMFATAAPAAADTSGWGCYSYTHNQHVPHGTVMDSPTYSGTGTHTCLDGQWTFTPKDCYVTYTYGDFGRYEGHTWYSHGQSGSYGDQNSQWGTCRDGKMVS